MAVAEEAPSNFAGIQIWEQSRKIAVKGIVNMQDGLVELLATAPGGKEHESVLVLQCNPLLLYTALGLIALNPAQLTDYRASSAADTLPGDQLFITVTWMRNGQQHTERAENLVWDKKYDRPMPKTHWVFTGSRFYRNRATGQTIFMAGQTGVLVATYFDADAIINNPLPERMDDTGYYANSKLLPPRGTEVTVLFDHSEK